MPKAGNGNPQGLTTIDAGRSSVLADGLPIVHLEPMEKPFTEPLRVSRKSYARIREVHPAPNLIEVQLESFKWFTEVGLKELFEEISPIQSFNRQLELYFLDYRFEDPKHTEKECRALDLTYAAPLWVRSRLINKETGEIHEQDVFMGDFPLMTSNGTFIINGAERVVVSQLIRSPGVYFTVDEDRATGRELAGAKLIPSRGAWLEFETSKRDVLSVKVDRKRKLPVAVLLRASGLSTDDELYETFRDVDSVPEHPYLASTIEKDVTRSREDALLEFYKKLRPGDPATLDNARSYLNGLLFTPRRYDLGRVGRHKLNRRLGLDLDLEVRTLTLQDLVAVVRHIIMINNGQDQPDDIDHLGNRRVKTVGELIQQQLRIGLLRMERVVRERMSIRDPEQLTPIALINIRPVVAATREFFGGSQLSQFMQQTNPLDELTHKRRLSALGPGGLRRERAGFDVRDVHHSHYGRICPIETPEGPNIGLIGSLATYATINEFGFIETPYRKVVRSVPNDGVSVAGHLPWEEIADGDGQPVARADEPVAEETARRLAELPLEEIAIVPLAGGEIVYLAADDEDKYIIAQANVRLDAAGRFLDRRVSVRHGSRYHLEDVRRVDYVDVSPKQIVSVSASLIPFLEHDDANRALMGSNMQRQAVPLIRPEAPIVATGMEYLAALDSGQVVVSEHGGEVMEASSSRIVIRTEEGEEVAYPLRKYQRSNQSTCIDQRPIVRRGDRVRRGEVIADSASTERGELALGQNVLVAFMSWEGGNYEDAVLISEELVRDDLFSSIHIEKHEIEARDTKLGPEEITRDIPNVGEEALANLDERGIIRIGAEVSPGDILVGKITPKGETDLTPEEKLLRAIFGEKAREVKDSSLRLPHGEKGKVVEVREFTREDHQDLPAGVEKMVRVSVAQQRKVTEGDKMAGRHGNKGVISKVVPTGDMPFLEDGTPVQMILNPLGVPARMNIGQILETHLGLAAQKLGFEVISPVFDGAREREIAAELARSWIMEEAWRRLRPTAWSWLVQQGYDLAGIVDNEVARQIYLSETLGEGKYDREHIRQDVAYARRVAMAELLLAEGYDPERLFSFGERGRHPDERSELDEEAIRACLRLWLSKHGVRVVEAWSMGQLEEQARLLSKRIRRPLPTSGKMILYDGKTGEPFDQPVTVGVIYMLKLAHLVEDKVHARSTGPYSLVTQQPLGGKAQFGGQRFGEMEVWALEAYGAAFTLQEMLTVKSDDVTGRVKTYEAIVKGEKIREPGVPESFRVLVKELQSLGLAVEVLDEKGEVIHFGREDGDERLPRLALGLGRPRY